MSAGPQDPFGTPPAAGGTGGQPAYGGGHQQKTGTNGLAIAALVTAFFIPLVGLILGFVAKSQINKTGQGGGGLATAAIIISVVSMVLGVIVFSGALAGT
jgi:hypothetical protein